MAYPSPTSTAALSPGPGPGPGGFLVPVALPSPAPSLASSAAVHQHALGLPHPRRVSLRPGSVKMETARRLFENAILHINRRFVKKYATLDQDDELVGYASMGELSRDVDELVNGIWRSGTPSLQVPYLLNLASELINWIDGFPPAPRPTLALLRKLDHCFASLVDGVDLETGEPLPGFDTARHAGLSRTDMVRCRSTAEMTRVLVAAVLSRPAAAEPTEGGGHFVNESDTNDDKDEDDDADEDDADEETLLGAGRIYQHTLIKIGEFLGGSSSQLDDGMPVEDENDDEY